VALWLSCFITTTGRSGHAASSSAHRRQPALRQVGVLELEADDPLAGRGRGRRPPERRLHLADRAHAAEVRVHVVVDDADRVEVRVDEAGQHAGAVEIDTRDVGRAERGAARLLVADGDHTRAGRRDRPRARLPGLQRDDVAVSIEDAGHRRRTTGAPTA
jgi:hypothetical protein